jgi:hypothetical protein
MGSFWWWAALTGAHALLFGVLWQLRREDHPWLLAYFGVQWLADLLIFLIFPAKLGGLNILGPFSPTLGGQLAIYYLSNVAWLTFWILPPLTAERLALGRTRRCWLPGLVAFAGVWLAVVYGFLTRAVSREVYLGLLHWLIEPALLIYALVCLGRYLHRCLTRALHIELLTLALLLECTNLSLKLLFALRPGLSLDRNFSALYYTVCFVTFFGYYAVVKVRERREVAAAPAQAASGPAPAE